MTQSNAPSPPASPGSDSSALQASASEPSTHERIRTVAADLFARLGYGGASMSEIAAQVGVRKASLYNYYRSKQDLLSELLRESIEAWRASSRAAFEGEGTHRERLREHLRSATEFAARHPERVAIVRVAATQIEGGFGERLGCMLDQQRDDYMTGLAEFFRRAIAAGEVADAPPEDLAMATRVFLDGLLATLLFQCVESEALLDLFPGLWRFFWRGIAAAPEAAEEGSPEGSGEGPGAAAAKP